MSEPPRDDAVIRFFGGAFIAIGWLVLTLGGLCTVIFGSMALGVDNEFRVRLEDWGLPLGMLASGAASLWIGRTIRRSAARAVPPGRTDAGRDTDG
jgi:hypothetical protein